MTIPPIGNELRVSQLKPPTIILAPKTGPLFWHGRGFVMAQKRHSDEDTVKLLREIEVKQAAGQQRAIGLSRRGYQ